LLSVLRTRLLPQKNKIPIVSFFKWISALMNMEAQASGMKIFLNPVFKKENCPPPGRKAVVDAFAKHVALSLVADTIEDVVIMREYESVMVTFRNFDLHAAVGNAVQDPMNNGEKIIVAGRCYRVTVAPIERPTDTNTYELFFGNYPVFARVLPTRNFLYKDLKIHVKYFSCPPGRKGGRANFLFVGLPDREAVDKIIEAKKAGLCKIEGRNILIAESQSMVKKNGRKLFAAQFGNPL